MTTKEMVMRFAGIKGYDEDEIIGVLVDFIEYHGKEGDLREFLQQGIDADEEEYEEPCYRVIDQDGCWWCVNDHTGCLWNDGNNGCTHEGKSCCPLEEE
jgi:hypothetical protein